MTRITKKGISLIVFVIIIVMQLNNTGVIEKANETVRATNLAKVKQLASVKCAEADLDGKTKSSELEEYVIAELKRCGIKLVDNNILKTIF